ncbi:ribbon-helix-helix protein, CopG family [Agitococcus lubricus]|uniref:Ribbon-helix-helix CopG family protein n=1 Tax=Agitococcus lubricus TaxID=1077255 RepID=A0A2T5J3X4_9GAMM|nr:ribbon-helix-helix protein, CopG family [Agitococcus lubricus]PTQ91317.1 ribbon-helix-helix CopG family protein [Agitococcus lubricus]
MENKTARLTILVDPVKKEAFEKLCLAQDLTPSQVVRQLIREYLEKHGVKYATQAKLARPDDAKYDEGNDD